jgi:hypothetical protein
MSVQGRSSQTGAPSLQNCASIPIMAVSNPAMSHPGRPKRSAQSYIRNTQSWVRQKLSLPISKSFLLVSWKITAITSPAYMAVIAIGFSIYRLFNAFLIGRLRACQQPKPQFGRDRASRRALPANLGVPQKLLSSKEKSGCSSWNSLYARREALARF